MPIKLKDTLEIKIKCHIYEKQQTASSETTKKAHTIGTRPWQPKIGAEALT